MDPSRIRERAPLIAGRLNGYIQRAGQAAELSERLSHLTHENRAEARELQKAVGEAIVILHGGLAYVPFLEPSGRCGYEVYTCLDLDAMRMGRSEAEMAAGWEPASAATDVGDNDQDATDPFP